MGFSGDAVANMKLILGSGSTSNMYNSAKTLSLSGLTTNEVAQNPSLADIPSIESGYEFQDSIRGEVMIDAIRQLGTSNSISDIEKSCTIHRNISAFMGY